MLQQRATHHRRRGVVGGESFEVAGEVGEPARHVLRAPRGDEHRRRVHHVLTRRPGMDVRACLRSNGGAQRIDEWDRRVAAEARGVEDGVDIELIGAARNLDLRCRLCRNQIELGL
ncbi:MAG: hypothetical protein WKF58_08170 [Ilumatobacteraceae bacterium]